MNRLVLPLTVLNVFLVATPIIFIGFALCLVLAKRIDDRGYL